MEPILETKDIICSFENSKGEKVSLTDSLVIHSTPAKDLEEETTLIFPIKRVNSYSVHRRQLYEFWIVSALLSLFWYFFYYKNATETTCKFLWFGCTKTVSNFFQNLSNAIVDGWIYLIMAFLFFCIGFIVTSKLRITTISQEKIDIEIIESAEVSEAKKFIKQLNKAYTGIL